LSPRFSEVDQVGFIIVFRKGFECFLALEDRLFEVEVPPWDCMSGIVWRRFGNGLISSM